MFTFFDHCWHRHCELNSISAAEFESPTNNGPLNQNELQRGWIKAILYHCQPPNKNSVWGRARGTTMSHIWERSMLNESFLPHIFAKRPYTCTTWRGNVTQGHGPSTHWSFFSLSFTHSHTTQLWMQQPTLHQSLMCLKHGCFDLTYSTDVICLPSVLSHVLQALHQILTVPQEGSDENSGLKSQWNPNFV